MKVRATWLITKCSTLQDLLSVWFVWCFTWCPVTSTKWSAFKRFSSFNSFTLWDWSQEVVSVHLFTLSTLWNTRTVTMTFSQLPPTQLKISSQYPQVSSNSTWNCFSWKIVIWCWFPLHWPVSHIFSTQSKSQGLDHCTIKPKRKSTRITWSYKTGNWSGFTTA